MTDPYHLQRFVDAQDPLYEQVCAELKAGRKLTHWMWFIFPQIAGLGSSAMARRYAIASRAEALAYLRHPILGSRLRECTALVNRIEGRTVRQIFDAPDDMKFHSSMTLFASVENTDAMADRAVFNEALHKYFADRLDAATLARI